MRASARILLALAVLLGQPVAAWADTTVSSQFRLRLEVPVVCNIRFESQIHEIGAGDWRLGNTRELCNSTKGYVVTAAYEPGTLVGARVLIGGRVAVLDGSGQTTVYASNGPANTQRTVDMTPGEAGFDTDQLVFSIQAA